jgi:hypothetical protein
MLMENDQLTLAEDRYVQAARAHARYSESDSDKANAEHDRLVAAFKELREAGDLGWAIVKRLAGHEDACVRLWGATHLLLNRPEDAVAILEELSARADMTGFQAEIVLSEWSAGTLRWA